MHRGRGVLDIDHKHMVSVPRNKVVVFVVQVACVLLAIVTGGWMVWLIQNHPAIAFFVLVVGMTIAMKYLLKEEEK